VTVPLSGVYIGLKIILSPPPPKAYIFPKAEIYSSAFFFDYFVRSVHIRVYCALFIFPFVSSYFIIPFFLFFLRLLSVDIPSPRGGGSYFQYTSYSPLIIEICAFDGLQFRYGVGAMELDIHTWCTQICRYGT
jgi:hypothetical protein